MTAWPVALLSPAGSPGRPPGKPDAGRQMQLASPPGRQDRHAPPTGNCCGTPMGGRSRDGRLSGGDRGLEQALHIHQSLVTSLAKLATSTRSGIVRRVTGDFPGAVAAQQRALHLYRDHDYQPDEANNLHYLRNVLRSSGD